MAKGLSANTVSRLKGEWAKEYDGWREEALDDEPNTLVKAVIKFFLWAAAVLSLLEHRQKQLR